MSRPDRSWLNFLEENTNFPLRQSGDWNFGPYNYGNCGPELMPTTLPGVCDPPSALKLPSQSASYVLSGGIETGHSDPANLSHICTNPNPTQNFSPPNYPYQLQSAPPAQAVAYAINQTGICFGADSSYPRYSIRQGQQPPSSWFQSRGFYPNLDTGNFAPSPLPPHSQPAHHGKKWDNAANYPPPGPHACDTCGVKCNRKADLDRHLRSTRKHRAAHGPVCPEIGCKYIERFTRVDNFRVHYRRQHGKSYDEAGAFIQQWKDKGSL